MNDKTIRALYLGKLRPEKSSGYKTEKYIKHLEEFNRLYDEVEAALPKEKHKLLDTMLEEYNESQGEIILDAFAQGFKIGRRLAAEGICFAGE